MTPNPGSLGSPSLSGEVLPSDTERIPPLQVGTARQTLRKIPFLRQPVQGEDGPWLKEGHEASAWLSLFYGIDIAVLRRRLTYSQIWLSLQF
jgi:hypothetical protein